MDGLSSYFPLGGGRCGLFFFSRFPSSLCISCHLFWFESSHFLRLLIVWDSYKELGMREVMLLEDILRATRFLAFDLSG